MHLKKNDQMSLTNHFQGYFTEFNSKCGYPSTVMDRYQKDSKPILQTRNELSIVFPDLCALIQSRNPKPKGKKKHVKT